MVHWFTYERRLFLQEVSLSDREGRRYYHSPGSLQTKADALIELIKGVRSELLA